MLFRLDIEGYDLKDLERINVCSNIGTVIW
jgi:hypothetical protein